ncbi:MAG: quinolinate synthase NadA [Phycisphaerae bacterium]|nr:quinolinate synthase NadA [Phycisphaerae bacterium]
MLWQPALPESYLTMSEDELGSKIAARRAELGSKLLILGHHYQQDDVIRHADLVGDSLKLSQMAAEEAPMRGARWIIFCGVHFMAETADILTPESVQVILPDLSAGCSMADMAAYDDTVDAWDIVQSAIAGTGQRVIPITYVNSSAAIKAFVGERGGACCTSSNAAAVFDWALRGGDAPLQPGESIKILFLPDQHLGRNTAKAKGFVTEFDATGERRAETALWDPKKAEGGIDRATIRDAKVLLWAGHCSVHKLFRPEHVDQARAEGRTVIVHPECAQQVVDRSDMRGSTEHIINTIAAAAPGSRWAIGTEFHLVNRLAQRAAERDVSVQILSDCQCLCTTMYRIDQQHLLWVLDHLAAGRVVNQVSVHPECRRLAKLALDRMLRNVSPVGAQSVVASGQPQAITTVD